MDGSEQVEVEVVIRRLANGQVSVSGPIQDKVLMYGLLECAKDAVREHITKEEAKAAHATPIVLPRGFRHTN